MPTVATYNNRAQAHINLKHWHSAMADCQSVLELEQGNVKGAFLFYISLITVLQCLQTEILLWSCELFDVFTCYIYTNCR